MDEELQAGARFGPYVVASSLGGGGMGFVYRARDPRLGRDVAIKVIRPEHCGSVERRRRFQTEAQSSARLAHPNVVAIYDVGEENGVPFIVTEVVEGGTLAGRLLRGRLTFAETLSLAIPIAEALSAAHERGIVHRDLKPGNILLTANGSPKIADFGLAKCLDDGRDSIRTDLPTNVATVEGTIVGTPAYMSPEQATGGEVTFRSDLFSFGAIVMEMLTGQRVFHRPTHAQTISAILTHEPDYRAIPGAIAGVLKRCLAKNPSDRYGSTADLIHDLRNSGTTTTRARRWPLLAAAATAAVITGVVVLRPNAPRPADAPRIQSLAILPLQNLSADPAHTYFADALTEELTAKLASLRSLRVASRTSAGAYRGTTKPLPEVARALGVDAIIEGSATRSGDRARVTVQLIDGRTDRHLWAQTFEKRGADVLALEQQIAKEIADHVRVTLSPAERERLSRVPTDNVEAYEAFLKARYHLDTRQAIGIDDAIRHAEKAVTLDPNFAEAYVALAEACQAKMFFEGAGKEYDERGFVAIQRALALDPSLPEAYIVRGVLRYNRWHNFDIAAAIRDYRHAVALDPKSVRAHHNLCSELNHAGLHDQAIAACSTALQIDPFARGAQYRLGRAHMQANRFAEAVALYERYNFKNFEQAAALAWLGRPDDADRLLNEATQSGTDNFDVLAVQALLAAFRGDRMMVERHSQQSWELGRKNTHFHHAAIILAAAAAEIGRPDDAVKWLRTAADSGMPNYPYFANNPSLRKLSGNPSYDSFMKSLKPRWEEIVAQATQNLPVAPAPPN